MPQTDNVQPAPFPVHTHVKKDNVKAHPVGSKDPVWDWWCLKCSEWVDEDHGISL